MLTERSDVRWRQRFSVDSSLRGTPGYWRRGKSAQPSFELLEKDVSLKQIELATGALSCRVELIHLKSDWSLKPGPILVGKCGILRCQRPGHRSIQAATAFIHGTLRSPRDTGTSRSVEFKRIIIAIMTRFGRWTVILGLTTTILTARGEVMMADYNTSMIVVGNQRFFS